MENQTNLKERMLVEAHRSPSTFSSSKFSQAVDSAFSKKENKEVKNEERK